MKKTRLVAITGLSGSGKSTAAKALEDAGFFVIDNLPSEMLLELLDLLKKKKTKITHLGVVIDARDPHFSKRFPDIWHDVKKREPDAQLLFIEAEDATLYRRFKETRRKHPLDKGDGLRAGIDRERKILQPLKDRADSTFQTDQFNVHQLKRLIAARYAISAKQMRMTLTLMSFGFKHGLPPEADLCFDARFLPNPYFIPSLKEKTGLQKSVSAYVLSQDGAQQFVEKIHNFIVEFLPLYEKEGKAYMTLAIGCTGGVHRAPALTASLAQKLKQDKIKARVTHRDINKD